MIDSGGLPVAGASVTVQSPSLQGSRTTKTSENGDYRLPLLPPGEYTLVFEFNRFATQKKSATVAATEPVTIDVTLAARRRRRIGQRPGECRPVRDDDPERDERQTRTSERAADRADESSRRPIWRPSVHATGPNGHLVISGAMSFESLFLVNGVQIQDNLRREPFTLFIEDAIQETTVSTSGISAEYGRFTGGIVNTITRSGSNTVHRVRSA